MKNSVSGKFIFFILGFTFTIVALCPFNPQAGKKNKLQALSGRGRE